VPEKKTDNVAERKSDDFIFVRDLLDAVFNVQVEENDLEKMYRLGRWTEDKARPLLVTFTKLELKDQVMTLQSQESQTTYRQIQRNWRSTRPTAQGKRGNQTFG